MFERFTDRARRVVVLAQEEARMLNHNYIGTEHILLGLIHEGEGVAAKALESLGISLEAVRAQVQEIIGGEPSIQLLDAVTRYGLDPDAAQTAIPTGGSVARAIGSFSYRLAGGGRITPDPAWVAANIRTEQVPILGAVTCHKVMLPQLRAALRDVVDAGLADRIHPGEFAGCYYPRFIAGTTSLSRKIRISPSASSGSSLSASSRSSTERSTRARWRRASSNEKSHTRASASLVNARARDAAPDRRKTRHIMARMAVDSTTSAMGTRRALRSRASSSTAASVCTVLPRPMSSPRMLRPRHARNSAPRVW